jgi:hypothetical protein
MAHIYIAAEMAYSVVLPEIAPSCEMLTREFPEHFGKVLLVSSVVPTGLPIKPA